jgi:transketolase
MRSMKTEELCINTIRMLALDMVQRANSGHPGMPLGAAPAAFVLWTKFMRFSPGNPTWADRDRFVLSAGHASSLLYACLHLTGHELSLEELKNFRQWGSKTPGHPELCIPCGIETTTGPLGQGFANGVGMAIAERHLAARFNRGEYEVAGHYTYGMVSDGDIMEGVAAEAASLAGHLGLGRLIYLYDSNDICLAGDTRLTFTEDVGKRFEAYGWQVQTVEDGNDAAGIEAAVNAAREEAGRPSLIIVRSHIGFGSPKQDSHKVHGSPLSEEEVAATKEKLGWPQEPVFHIPGEVLPVFAAAGERGARLEREWNSMMGRYGEEQPGLMAEWKLMNSKGLGKGWDTELPVFAADAKGIATRAAGGQVMNALARHVPSLVGGSADLDPSTNTALVGEGSFQAPGTGDDTVPGAVPGPWGYEGRNIAFGVRELAMGAIVNGMAAHGGFIPYGSTFLVFADYMRPAIRLSALGGLHAVYVFTHDSVGVGEDGPTHQPVEHLASLRAIPGLTVIRPADANEVVEAWKTALKHTRGPVVLVHSRQKLPVLDRESFPSAAGLHRGAYVLTDSAELEVILMASGSEVHLLLEAAEILSHEGIGARVVSMPSWELFEEQPEEYRLEVLPPEITTRLAVEAGVSQGWHKYVGRRGEVMSIERFGASAPGGEVLAKLGFTSANVAERARLLFKKHRG